MMADHGDQGLTMANSKPEPHQKSVECEEISSALQMQQLCVCHPPSLGCCCLLIEKDLWHRCRPESKL